LPQFYAFSVLGTWDTQNTRDLGTEIPKTQGYPNHCDTAILRSGEDPGDEIVSPQTSSPVPSPLFKMEGVEPLTRSAEYGI